MGSFNTTCAVSKTPIRYNQKARVFFLIMNTFEHHYHNREKGFFSSILQGSQCYPWDNFKVIGYPMLGVYKDYNQYEFEDKYLEDLNLSIINKIYIPNTIQEGKEEKDYNKYHDYLNIEKIIDMKQLQDMEHSGALRVQSHHGVSIIAKMAIHEDVFQQLIKPNIFGINTIEYDKKYSKEQYYEHLLDIINNKNKLIKDKDMDIDSKFIDYMIQDKLNQIFKHEGFYQTYPNLIFSEDQKEKILESYTDYIWTAYFFQQYKLEFLPVMLSGQEVDNYDHSIMLKKLSTIVENLKSDYEEESLTLYKEVSEKLYISLNELEQKFHEWYDDEEPLTDYSNFVKEVKEKNIEFLNLDEENSLTDFLLNYPLLKINSGIIYFKE